MKKIAAFTQSSLKIGSGHLVRMSQIISCLDDKKNDIELYCDYDETPDWFNKIEHRKINENDFFKKEFSNYDLVIYDSYLNRDKLKKIKTDVLLVDDFAYFGQYKFVEKILDYNYGTSENKYSNKQLFLGTNYFPIGKNTYPENVSRSSFDLDSKNILLSLGGVSDTKLIDIQNLLNSVSEFGKIFLMDPLSKLKDYESKNITILQNTSLSKALRDNNFKFGVIAGGTSKYIASAFRLPSFFIGRNELENLLIDEFEKSELSLNLNYLNSKNNLENQLINANKNLKKIFDGKNENRINKIIDNL